MSEHSAEFMSQIRHKSSSRIRIGCIPAVPAQRLLHDLQLKPPMIHRHRKKASGNPSPVRGLRDAAHMVGPLMVVDQRRLHQHDDSGKLRIVPVDRQGRAGARYGFAALENAYSALLPDGPMEIAAKVPAKPIRNFPAFPIRGVPHHIQREERTCRHLHGAADLVFRPGSKRPIPDSSSSADDRGLSSIALPGRRFEITRWSRHSLSDSFNFNRFQKGPDLDSDFRRHPGANCEPLPLLGQRWEHGATSLPHCPDR